MPVGVPQRPQRPCLKIVGYPYVLLLLKLPMTQLMIKTCSSTVHFKLGGKNF